MGASGVYDMVLGSRILGAGALKGGMPFYKYVSNRFLTAFQNLFLGVKLSEYHTGFRAFSRELLETLPLHENSDDFIFDNQMIVQAVMFGFRIGEISCPTKYFGEASSINFKRSVQYGLGVLATTASYVLHKWKLRRAPIFDTTGRRATLKYYSETANGPAIRNAYQTNDPDGIRASFADFPDRSIDPPRGGVVKPATLKNL
jgi:hypothetical protein